MKIPSIALGLLVSLSACSAHISGQLMMQELNPHVYCGLSLARALAELCSFQSAEKRSGTINNAILTPHYEEQELHLWPWLTSHKAHAIALPSRGKRFRGVVDECCDKPCSIDEMLSYCGN